MPAMNKRAQQVLGILSQMSTASPQEVSEIVDGGSPVRGRAGSMQVLLSSLQSKGLVTLTGVGSYEITEEGREALQEER